MLTNSSYLREYFIWNKGSHFFNIYCVFIFFAVFHLYWFSIFTGFPPGGVKRWRRKTKEGSKQVTPLLTPPPNPPLLGVNSSIKREGVREREQHPPQSERATHESVGQLQNHQRPSSSSSSIRPPQGKTACTLLVCVFFSAHLKWYSHLQTNSRKRKSLLMS